MKHGYGDAFGAGTIVNAIATWKGAAFGISMKTEVDVELKESDSTHINGHVGGANGADPHLIVRCVELVLEKFGLQMEGDVYSRSEIPVAKGLKSSSAAANAAVVAALRAIGEDMEPLEIVKLGVKAAKDAGVTITGAFDDACASFFGGAVLTNNKNMELIERVPLEGDVLVFSPPEKTYTSTVDVESCRLLAPLVEVAYSTAMAGELMQAMTINGLIYCAALGYRTDVVMEAIRCGAAGCGISGTGPAYTAVFIDGGDIECLREKWEEMGADVIQTKVENMGVEL